MAKPNTSAVQFAYDALKEWILTGKLTAGKKIDQSKATKELNLSLMPIRSALDRLAAEGLVVKTPHRGCVVSPLSAENLNQIYDARAQVEAMAVALAAANASKEDIDQLRNALQPGSVRNQELLESTMTQNRNFHRSVIELSKNDVLIRMFNSLWEQSERYRRLYYQNTRSHERILLEHQHLLELISKQRAQEAADFMVTHTRESQRILLESMGYQLPPLQFKLIFLATPSYWN